MATQQGPVSAGAGASDIDKLRSGYDRKIAGLERMLQERDALIESNQAALVDVQTMLSELREQSYENEDPAVKELRKENAALKGRVQDLDGKLRQTIPHLRGAKASELAYELYPGKEDRELRQQAIDFLNQSQDSRDMDSRYRQLEALSASRPAAAKADEGGGAQTSQGGDEFDAGRGSGFGGGVSITRELLEEKQGDFAWWDKHEAEIEAAVKSGTLE